VGKNVSVHPDLHVILVGRVRGHDESSHSVAIRASGIAFREHSMTIPALRRVGPEETFSDVTAGDDEGEIGTMNSVYAGSSYDPDRRRTQRGAP
jgi:hypothetical protein